MLKRTIFVAVFATLTAAFALSVQTPVLAQGKAGANQRIKLGVLDVRQVIRQSKMTQDIKRQRDQMRREFREEIKSDEEALRKANQELERQRVILAPEALEQERRNFRQRGVELQRKVQARNQLFSQTTRKTDEAFRAELQKAVKELSNTHRFTLILQRQNVVLRADFLDVTSLVIEILNKNVTSYKVPTDIKATATKAKK